MNYHHTCARHCPLLHTYGIRTPSAPERTNRSLIIVGALGIVGMHLPSSPLGDLSDAIPDESDKQSDSDKNAEEDEADEAPGHELVCFPGGRSGVALSVADRSRHRQHATLSRPLAACRGWPHRGMIVWALPTKDSTMSGSGPPSGRSAASGDQARPHPIMFNMEQTAPSLGPCLAELRGRAYIAQVLRRPIDVDRAPARPSRLS
jgi:hypothetical protein